jgi:hypothetical protein
MLLEGFKITKGYPIDCLDDDILHYRLTALYSLD